MPEEKISEASQEERIPADAGTHAKGGETVAEAEPIADVPNRLEEPGREAFSRPGRRRRITQTGLSQVQGQALLV